MGVMTSDNSRTGLQTQELKEMAARIGQARRTGHTLSPLTDSRPLSLDDAYLVQAELTVARLRAGERLVGWKLGYTSGAMREQMGIDGAALGARWKALSGESLRAAAAVFAPDRRAAVVVTAKP